MIFVLPFWIAILVSSSAPSSYIRLTRRPARRVELSTKHTVRTNNAGVERGVLDFRCSGYTRCKFLKTPRANASLPLTSVFTTIFS
ncbi:hypothetical protein DFH07DRAFT_803613 [Mycena maculata]|uniref:Secreted protein n=1 Tax=Mycena maculata TaxID=230809 RepID=A0AAD7NRN6_9AGAR|nr:hypothetical protein DFH07DRAFT_803613 [Mycena maculata]